MRDIMLIVHFISLALGLGAGFAHLFLGLSTKNMDDTQAAQFRIQTLSINLMSKIGLTLLIISGGYLMTPYWSNLAAMPFLHFKFTLFGLILILLIPMSIYSKKAKKNQDFSQLKKIKIIGRLMLLCTIWAVILAVKQFH
jgi:uncharacterized membrane protein